MSLSSSKKMVPLLPALASRATSSSSSRLRAPNLSKMSLKTAKAGSVSSATDAAWSAKREESGSDAAASASVGPSAASLFVAVGTFLTSSSADDRWVPFVAGAAAVPSASRTGGIGSLPACPFGKSSRWSPFGVASSALVFFCSFFLARRIWFLVNLGGAIFADAAGLARARVCDEFVARHRTRMVSDVCARICRVADEFSRRR